MYCVRIQFILRITETLARPLQLPVMLESNLCYIELILQRIMNAQRPILPSLTMFDSALDFPWSFDVQRTILN